MRPTIMSCATLILAGLAGLPAADEAAAETAAPAVVTSTVDALQKEVGKGYAAYHAALVKAEDRAAKDLQKAITEATKRGDLETATAIKTTLDELRAGTLRERLEAKVRPDIDLLGDLPPAEDALHTLLAKGNWILDRAGVRNELPFGNWTKPDASANRHWSCTVAPDVSITLINGIRLRLRSTGLSVDTEFVSDAKGEKLTAANGWIIRPLATGEEMPKSLEEAEEGPQRGPGRRR